jgi:hypothetical protein
VSEELTSWLEAEGFEDEGMIGGLEPVHCWRVGVVRVAVSDVVSVFVFDLAGRLQSEARLTGFPFELATAVIAEIAGLPR